VRIKIKETKNYEREMEIHLNKDDISPYYEKKYAEFKENADLSGFRKGKVPLNLIKKMFSKKINTLVLGEVIEDFYSKALEKKKLDPVNKAQIDVIEYEPDDHIKFKAIFEVEPEFEVTGLENITLKKQTLKPDEDAVDKELERIQLESGTKMESEGPADSGDFVLLDIQEIDPKTGIQIIGKKHNDVYVRLGSEELEKDISEKLIGAKVNDTIDVARNFDFMLTQQQNESISERLLLHVKKIEKVDVPPLDDEFVKGLKGDYKDLNDLKNKIKESLEISYNNQSERMFNNLLKDELVKTINPEIPPSMTDYFLVRMMEDEKKRTTEPVDEIHFKDQNKHIAEWNLKWYLIKKKYMEQEKIEVADDEMYKRLEMLAALQNVNYPQLKRDYRLNKEKYNWLKEEMLEEKILSGIKEKINIEES